MIYHAFAPKTISDALLILENLAALSSLTSQSVGIIPDLQFWPLFRKHPSFVIVDEIPTCIRIDISGTVCLFDKDVLDVKGSEFISYKRSQDHVISRLDKFLFNDFEVIVSRPEYFESKFFTSDEEALFLAKTNAMRVDFDKSMMDKIGDAFFGRPSLPLVLSPLVKLESECYSVGGSVQNSIDIMSLITSSMKEVPIEMILSRSAQRFSYIYGEPSDPLFNLVYRAMLKNRGKFEPNVVFSSDFALVENFKFKTVNEFGFFFFSQKFFNLSRADVMTLMRTPDCLG